MFKIILFAVCAGVHTLSVLAANNTSSGLLYHHQYQKVQYSTVQSWNNLHTDFHIHSTQFFNLLQRCRLAREWCGCHWIGLEKDINRYRFLIFNFDLEYLKRVQSSEPQNTKMLLRHTVCIESFLPIGWRTFI
jgi:hypothetical protein